MNPCTDCSAARETNGLWRMFNNRACLYCAARLIQTIPAQEPVRRRAMLDESAAAGLDPARIREMVRGPMAIAPLKK